MRVATRGPRRSAATLLALGIPFLGLACADAPTGLGGSPDFDTSTCDLPTELITDSGVGRGGIPTLRNPDLTPALPGPENAYLDDLDRVLGVLIAGEAIAIPHNILWYHEIVNLNRGGEHIAITYCPLTGSSLGFDRSSIEDQELGVTGLLFMNNLIMFNWGEPESLWPQMLGEAKCKADIGRTLDRFPIFEMTWRGWKALYPETSVVSSEVNNSRDYTVYPYGDYEQLDDPDFLFPTMPAPDTRRAAKERVLGLPSTNGGEPGIAFPFLALDEQLTSWAVVEAGWNGEDVVIFWSGNREGAGAFRPVHPGTGERLTFRATPFEGIVDDATGSRWSIAGEAIEGELAGQRLEPVAEAYVAFWGAWAAFHPLTRLWQGA